MTVEKNKNLKTFQSFQAYSDFEKVVKGKFRYVHDKSTKRFLTAALLTSNSRKIFIHKGQIYWRAQLGCIQNRYTFDPYPPERMKPPFGKAKEGRANPKGISCLYLATNMQTAIQEVRPWLESNVTVAQFQVAKDLELIDCSKHIHKLDGTGFDSLYPYIGGDEKKFSNSEIEECVWSWIDRAFSMPVDPSDDTADYVPTQILAEFFKASRYDGIIYNSLFAGGKNLVLFDVDSAEVLDCKLYRIINMPPFEFREITYDF